MPPSRALQRFSILTLLVFAACVGGEDGLSQDDASEYEVFEVDGKSDALQFARLVTFRGPAGSARLVDYGCFCGAWNDAGKHGTPVDGFDAVCKQHDSNWGACTASHDGALCGRTRYQVRVNRRTGAMECLSPAGSMAQCCCEADVAMVHGLNEHAQQAGHGVGPDFVRHSQGRAKDWPQICCSAKCGRDNNYCGAGPQGGPEMQCAAP